MTEQHPLRTMLDRLLDPWPLKIDWAERVADCTAECNELKLTLTVPQLRHFECDCPSRIEYRQTYPMQVPILTQLFEAKYEVPVTGDNGKGPTKLEAPLPGNLVVPDTLLWNIRIAAGMVVSDWSLHLSGGRQNGKTSGAAWLQALRAAQGRRLPEELDDAAGALRPSYEAAMRYLGYGTDRVMLVDTCCDECGGVLSAPRQLGQDDMDVHCEGLNEEPPCGRSYRPEEWLAMHAEETRRAVANGAKTHCPRRHPYDGHNTRISTDGKRRCRICEHDRKMLRSTKR